MGVRIAQVSPWFSPHFGGVESHVRSLSRELAHRGHEVTVVTSQHNRTLSAEEALAAGATYLVVGRPIIAAADPRAAAERMAAACRAIQAP